MLQPADERLDLSSAQVGLGEDDRPFATERARRRREPGTGGCDVPLEKVECLAEDSREPEQAIRLLGLEAALRLPPVEGPQLDIDHRRQHLSGKPGVPLEAVERGERQPFAYASGERQRALLADSEEAAVGVRFNPAAGAGFPTVAGSASICHMA